MYGHSSGAGLALYAAAHGLPVTKLVLHEPPYTPDDEEWQRTSRKDAETIKTRLTEGRRGDAIAHILSGIGMPQEMVDRTSHDDRVVAMAHTLAYDSEIMGAISRSGAIPTDLAGTVTVPALVLYGGASPAWMIDVGRQVADVLSDGRHRVFDGEGHYATPEVLAPALSGFFG